MRTVRSETAEVSAPAAHPPPCKIRSLPADVDRGTMSSTTAIARLRTLAGVLERTRAAPWFVEALRTYERGAADGVTLDQVLGLTPPPGGDGWWEAEPRARRDAALRAVHRQHFGDLCITAAAREIGRRAQRLQLAALRREAEPPQPGDALLVDALASGVPIPRPRQLVNILCNQPPGFAASR